MQDVALVSLLRKQHERVVRSPKTMCGA